MKKSLLKLSLVTSIFVTSASALTINEAVQTALKNNLELKQSSYDLKNAQENININNANFLPKIDLNYNYQNANKVVQGEKETANFSAKISYNLFNGNIDKNNKESAVYQANASEFQLNAKRQDIILSTKKAYINYLNKKNALETFKSAYSLFEQQYNDSKNRYEQGLLAKNDLLSVQVNMSTSKQNVIRAKADLRIAQYELENILGGKDLSSENIEQLNDVNFSIPSYDINLLENRSEIKALKMSIDSIQNQKLANSGEFLPKINASLSHNRFYEDFLSEPDSGLKDQNVIALNATWNLYNGNINKTQNRILLNSISKLKTQLAKARLDIKLQYANAKANLDVAIDNYETAKLALKQAEENYKIVKNRFKEGVSTSTDLTDANYLLTSSKQNFSKAYFDKFLANATILRILEK